MEGRIMKYYNLIAIMMLCLSLLSSCISQPEYGYWQRFYVSDDETITYIKNSNMGESTPKTISFDELKVIVQSITDNDTVTLDFVCAKDAKILKRISDLFKENNIKYIYYNNPLGKYYKSQL